MSLIVVGLNHRTAPVELLERMTVPEELLAKVLHDLAAREHLLEVVVLSTCNRIEVYARCTHFHPAVGDVSAFLADYSGTDPDDFAELLYTYYDDAAVAHLFAVAAGLDSMIVGESEILGQVRDAWQTAVREGTAPQLAGLFRHAVESGKRVRSETGIGRHPVSIPSAAVSVAADGTGRNSPFTGAFLQHVATPGVEVEVLMKRVSGTVEEVTEGKQQPERLSRLKREFYFVPK